jgi:hypothetical protein
MIKKIREDKKTLLRQLKNEVRRKKLRKIMKKPNVPSMNFKSNRQIT